MQGVSIYDKFYVFKIYWQTGGPTKMSVKSPILILESIFLAYTLTKDHIIKSHYHRKILQSREEELNFSLSYL